MPENLILFGQQAHRNQTNQSPAVTDSSRFTLTPASDAAERAFARLLGHLRAVLPPDADIEHVGATAVPGCDTKGDLDIAVRVAPGDFKAADLVLSGMFERNFGSGRSESFSAFKDDGAVPPLGVQLAVRGSPTDVFVRFRGLLLADAGLVARYNALKRAYDGRGMGEYRAAKSAFIEAALAAKLLAATDAHFAWMLGEAPVVDPLTLKLPAGGVDDAETLRILRASAAGLRARQFHGCWLIVSDDEVAGLISYKGWPNKEGAVEIGFGVAQSRRCRSHATAAVKAVVDLARADDRIKTLTAETAPPNIASQAALTRAGFKRARARTDPEDGPLLIWHHDLS